MNECACDEARSLSDASHCFKLHYHLTAESLGRGWRFCVFSLFVKVSLVCGNDRLDPKGGLGIGMFETTLVCRNLWTSAQGYLAINWRGEVGRH